LFFRSQNIRLKIHSYNNLKRLLHCYTNNTGIEKIADYPYFKIIKYIKLRIQIYTKS
jgi:hypothetical protein